MEAAQAGLAWQTGVWDRMSEVYVREVDARFAPVVAHTVTRAALRRGDAVLDLGTGTGAVALEAAAAVGAEGSVLGVDISGDMLEIADRRLRHAGYTNADFREGRAELIPADPEQFDAIVASLCFMYVIDRAAAAAECARVLRRGGRFVAAVWAGPEDADIVRFQATAGRFAPPPPVPGVGPGALADPSAFLGQLHEAGIEAHVETETVCFDFSSFDAAWDVLAGVTTASLPPDRVAEAQAAVRDAMWPEPASPRTFANRTQLLIGTRV